MFRLTGGHLGDMLEHTTTSSDVIMTSSHRHASLRSVTTPALGKQLRSQTTVKCSQSNIYCTTKDKPWITKKTKDGGWLVVSQQAEAAV